MPENHLTPGDFISALCLIVCFNIVNDLSEHGARAVTILDNHVKSVAHYISVHIDIIKFGLLIFDSKLLKRCGH